MGLFDSRASTESMLGNCTELLIYDNITLVKVGM